MFKINILVTYNFDIKNAISFTIPHYSNLTFTLCKKEPSPPTFSIHLISTQPPTFTIYLISNQPSTWIIHIPHQLARKLASKSSYQLFQSQLNELLLQLNEPLLNQVALLFSVTRSAINLVGINSENASKLKHYLLLYYNSHFALQVASVGGLVSTWVLLCYIK